MGENRPFMPLEPKISKETLKLYFDNRHAGKLGVHAVDIE
jgi:hypothetical protein